MFDGIAGGTPVTGTLEKVFLQICLQCSITAQPFLPDEIIDLACCRFRFRAANVRVCHEQCG